MAKKKQNLSPEERLAAALVPEEEWPYALPEGWKWVRLGKIYDVNPKVQADDDLEASFVTMSDISPGIKSQFDFIVRKWGEIKKGHTQFANGDVAFAKISPCFENRKSMILDGLKNGIGAGTTELIVLRNPSIDNKYTFLLISSEEFIRRAQNTYKGVVGQQRINLDFVKSYPMPLPPLSEQHRLVARIESLFAKLDAARENVQSVLDSHETRKAALLHDAFTGKLTAKWREEQGITFESWHSDTLKNLCEKITDGTHHSPPNAETGDYMYITAKNIKETGIELDNVTYVTAAVHEEIYSRCDVQKGDVLYIKDGATTGIATVNTLDEPFSLLSSVAVLRPHKDLLLSSYLKHLLNSAEQKSKMIRNMSGNAITRLTLSKIKATSIKVCSLPEQQEIVRILDRLLAREQRARQAAEETLAAIDRMKQSILARAFRGEL